MKGSSYRFSVFPLILLLCLVFSCEQQREEVKVENKTEADLELDRIPEPVMDALSAKFPNAEIQKCTKEKEDDIVVYDFEFTQEMRKFEADIKEDGTFHNWEREITYEDLPEAVKKVIEAKHPQSTATEIMEITAVDDGVEAVEGYEVVFETAEKRKAEVTVAPDGEILEDSGEE